MRPTNATTALAEPAASGGQRLHRLRPPSRRLPALAGDLRLFAMTFAGGFLFMTVYLV